MYPQGERLTQRTFKWLLFFSLVILLFSPIQSQAIGLLCSFSTSPVVFGTYNPIAKGDTLTSSNFTVSCIVSTVIILKLSQGNSGTSFSRYMLSSPVADKLYYNNYTDSGRTVVWGDGTSGTSYFSQNILGILSSYSIPIYGKIVGEQKIRAGMYNDTIQVELVL